MSTYDSIPSSQVAASLGSGVGVSEVISWQVSRALSGGGLPQQARAVSGSSVGSGSVTLVPDAPGESPWSVNATSPGQAVSIDAAADADAPVSPIARMVSRDVSADGWLSPARTLSIEDEVPRGQVLIPESVMPGAVDAAGVIEVAARESGRRCTPPPGPGAVLDLPLVGHPWARPGRVVAPGPLTYRTVGGVAMLSGSTVVVDTDELYVNLEGAIRFTLWSDGGTASVTVRDVEAGVDRLRVSFAAGAVTLTGTSTSVSHLVDASSPRRVEVIGRRAGAVTWTLWVDGVDTGVSVSSAHGPLSRVTVVAADRAGVGGVVADHGAVPVSFVPAALVAAAGSPLEAIAEPTSGDAWDVIQQVAAATLGAAWIDEEGRLIYRNRDQLRGGVPQYTIQALDHLEDVPWSISTDEIADRVEFTYRPPTVSIQTNDTLTVWQSTETVRVNAGQTVNLTHDIDGAASGLAPWYRVEDTSPPVTRMSRYAAWTAPPGESGSAPPASALVVSSEMLSPTRIRITIRNTTGAALWLYELIARARVHVAPGADVTIARGLSADKAQRPLPINAGSWVQDDTTAQQIADWLESQSANPLPTIPAVRVIPDASRRLGDVVRVRVDSIGGHEPVVFKALITAIDNSQSAGTYEQRLGLTILAVTFDDWMRWGQALGIDTFDALASHLSHLTSFDQLDRWLTNLGGDL